MTVQEELAHPDTAGSVAGAPDWWHSRSCDELQAILRRGIQGGENFFAAAAEMERRARESEAARDAQQIEAVNTSRRLGWELTLLFVLLGVGLLVLLLRW